VVPAVLLLVTFYLYPTLKAFQFSTMTGSGLGEQRFVGLANYGRMLTDPDFYHSVWVTIVYVAASGAATIALALLLADLLRRVSRLRHVLQGVYFYPVVLSTVIAAVVFVSVFNPFSAVMRTLPLPGMLGSTNWLQSTALVIPALVIFTTWKGLGFYLILFMAAMANLPRDVLDAAKADGATNWQTMWRVVLPLLRPAIVFAWVVNIVYGFQNFALVFSLTRGGPGDASRTLPIMIYDEAFKFFNRGYASTVAVAMFLIMGVLSFAVFRIVGSERGGNRA
jgi:multiple sugar transport system permease protein